METVKLQLTIIIALLFAILIGLGFNSWAITSNQKYALCIDRPTIAACKDWKP